MVQLNAASGIVLAVVALNAINTLAAPMPAHDVDELVAREPRHPRSLDDDEFGLFAREDDEFDLYAREPEPLKLPGVGKVLSKVAGKAKDAVKHHKAKPHHSSKTDKINTAVEVGQLGVDAVNAAKQQRSFDEEEFELVAREPLKLPGVGKVLSKVAGKAKNAVKHHKAKPHHSSKTEKINTAVEVGQLGVDAVNAAKQQRSFDEEEFELVAREPLKLPGVGKILSKVAGKAKNAVKHHKAKPHHSSKTDKINTAVEVGQLGVDTVNAAKQQRSFDEEDFELVAREPLKLPGVGKILSKVAGKAKDAVKHHKAKPHHSSKTDKINTAVEVGQLGVDAVNAAKQQRSFDEEDFELVAREPLKLPGVGKILSNVAGKAKDAVKHHKAKPNHSTGTQKVNTAVEVGQLGLNLVNAAKQQRSFDDEDIELVARAKTKAPSTPKPKQNKPKNTNNRQHSSGTERVNTALDVGRFGLDVVNTVKEVKNSRREFYEYDMDMLD